MTDVQRNLDLANVRISNAIRALDNDDPEAARTALTDKGRCPIEYDCATVKRLKQIVDAFENPVIAHAGVEAHVYCKCGQELLPFENTKRIGNMMRTNPVCPACERVKTIVWLISEGSP